MDRTRITVCMGRAARGDADAFGQVADAAQDELFRLALSLGLKREDAVEATQEALLRAWSRRRKYKRDRDAVGWLCGITLNVCREHRRKTSRDVSWLRENQLELAGAMVRANSPVLTSEQLRLLASAVDNLPPRQCEAIACRYLRRMSIRETAEAMECAEGTVKSAVSAALQQLHSLLESKYEE